MLIVCPNSPCKSALPPLLPVDNSSNAIKFFGNFAPTLKP